MRTIRPMSVTRWLVLGCTAAIIMLAMLPGVAGARAGGRRPVSGLPYRNGAACQSSGADGEVSVAVDATHPGRMVAAWMQDLVPFASSSLSNNLVVVSASSDGGATWTPRAGPPGVSSCATPPGPAFAGVFDPSLSVGPDGRWYLAMTGGQPGPPEVYVTTSTDGRHWSTVPTPLLSSAGADSPTIVADPIRPGRAYVTWSNLPALLMSVTDDGGRSFSPPVVVRRTPVGLIDDPSRVVALSDGSLLAVFDDLSFSDEASGKFAGTLFATRSVDSGAHWSTPARIGAQPQSGVVDPINKTLYQKFSVFSVAAGPNQTAMVAWTTTSGVTSGDIHIAVTADAGQTWAPLADLHRPAQTFQATVAVAKGGAIAATWYAFDGPQPPGMSRPTELWAARSDDEGATWSVRPLAGPFDLAAAAGSNFAGNYLGDYQALVASGGSFEAAFTIAKPLAANGPTDIFATYLPSS